MPNQRVLVVGTTPDYIAYIEATYPDRALFLTEEGLRTAASEPMPESGNEITCDLRRGDQVAGVVRAHLQQFDLQLSGITCYDCEWLELASMLAETFGLRFVSPQSVRLCRDKQMCKTVWSKAGVPCPEVRLLNCESDLERVTLPAVVKPASGAGSELTFLCRTQDELHTAFKTTLCGLAVRQHLPLYRSLANRAVVAESFVMGTEYSADFMVGDGQVSIVRVADKIRDDSLAFGTTVAYVVPARLPSGLTEGTLARQFKVAAEALGITHALCMVDFIVNDNNITFLELTPRPGGDCLPSLIKWASGVDTIGLALDFAEGKPVEVVPTGRFVPHVGVRVFVTEKKVVLAVDFLQPNSDPRVREAHCKRRPGHIVVPPPQDYDSWLLGHVIFQPDLNRPLLEQCSEIRTLCAVDLERHDDYEFTGIHSTSRRAS